MGRTGGAAGGSGAVRLAGHSGSGLCLRVRAKRTSRKAGGWGVLASAFMVRFCIFSYIQKRDQQEQAQGNHNAVQLDSSFFGSTEFE